MRNRIPLILSLMLSIGFALAWIYSHWRIDGFERNWPDGGALVVVLKQGLLHCTFYTESSNEDLFFRFPPEWRVNRQMFKRPFRWFPWYQEFAPPPGSWEAALPLYLPTFLFALASAWLWRRHRASPGGKGFSVKPRWGDDQQATTVEPRPH